MSEWVFIPIYMLGSLFDWIGVIVLLGALFRTDIRMLKVRILLSCLVFTVINYMMQIEWGLLEIHILIQFIMYIMGIQYVFEVKWGHAILMVFVGVIAYVIIQLSVMNLYQLVGYADVPEVTPSNPKILLHQFTSGGIACVLAYWLRRFRIGFLFIKQKTHVARIPYRYVALLLLSTTFVFLMNELIYNILILKEQADFLWPAIIMNGIAILIAGYIALQEQLKKMKNKSAYLRQ